MAEWTRKTIARAVVEKKKKYKKKKKIERKYIITGALYV